MTNRTLVISPRGFSSTRSTTKPTDTIFSDGDPEINGIYAEMIKRPSAIREWTFVASVLRVASRLLGNDLTAWVGAQRSNLYLHAQAINFVNDTINYINGKQRTIAVVNWIELLEERPEPLPRKLSTPMIGDLGTMSSRHLTTWLSRDRGLEDLVYTLFVMYGDANPSALRLDGTKPVSSKNPILGKLKKLLG